MGKHSFIAVFFAAATARSASWSFLAMPTCHHACHNATCYQQNQQKVHFWAQKLKLKWQLVKNNTLNKTKQGLSLQTFLFAMKYTTSSIFEARMSSIWKIK